MRENCLTPRLLVMYARFLEARGLEVVGSDARYVRNWYSESRQTEVSSTGYEARVDERYLTVKTYVRTVTNLTCKKLGEHTR